MISQYITNYLRGTAKGVALSLAKQATTAPLANYIKAIRNWIGVKTEEASVLSNIVGCLVSNPELLGDYLFDKVPIHDSPDDFKYISEISDELYQNVVQVIKDSLNFAATTDTMSSGSGLTISNASGYPVQFILDKSVGQLHGIATTYNPTDYRDFFIYTDGNKCYINPLLKTIGYHRPGQVYNDPTTIRDLLLGISDYAELNLNEDTIDTFITTMYHSITGLSDHNTIDNMLQACCSQLDLEYTGTLYNDLLTLYHYFQRQWNDNQTVGIKIYIADFMRNLAVKSELMDLYLEIGEIITKGDVTFDLLRSSLSTWIADKAMAVKQTCQDAISAFNKGGYYGLIMWLIQVIKGESSVTQENGVLVFTDNNSLIPTQYIATMVCTVVGTVVSLAGMIASKLSPIFAVIGGVLGSVLTAIPQAFNYDFSENTLAAISDTKGFAVDVVPFATAQFTIRKTRLGDFGYIDIQSMISSTGSVVALDVPGGVLLIGESDDPSYYRAEFHPSFGICRYNNIANLFHFCKTDVYGSFIAGNPPSWHTINAINFSGVTKESIMSAWAADYENFVDLVDENVEKGKHVLSIENDRDVRMGVILNYCLFYVWLATGTSQLADIYSYDWITTAISITTPSVRVGQLNYDLSFSGCVSGLITALSYFNPAGIVYQDMPNYNVFNVTGWDDIGSAIKSDASNSTLQLNFNWLSYDAEHDRWELHSSVSEQASITYSFNYSISNKMFYGLAYTLPVEYSYRLLIPKYDRDTFWGWVILSTLVVAAVTTVTIVASIKIKKWRQRKRAQLTAKVANNWDKYSNSMKEYNPNDEDDRPEYHTAAARSEAYTQYFKSVKKNNRWAAIIGGTKYSTAGYWDSDVDDTEVVDPTESDSYESGFSGSSYEADIQDQVPNKTTDVDNNYVTLLYIKQLITGVAQENESNPT